MDLKDLAGDQVQEVNRPSVKTKGPQSATTSRPLSTTGKPWLVIRSHLLDEEQIVLVLERKQLSKARQANPGKLIYVPLEIEELQRHRDSPDYRELVRKVHLIKKEFDGWIVPPE